jgi:LPS export ABC transporter protein LptC
MFCVAVVCIAHCGKNKETVPVSDSVIDHPYQEIDSTAMYYFNGGKLQWKLESQYMRKVLADTGHVLANPVKLYVYDSLGRESMRVLSDSGNSDAPMQMFTVWGNVFVRASNGICVASNRLFWNMKTHRITSDEFVQIKTRNGDILQGKGLEAAEDFSWWKFLHDVSGRFPNFKERVDKGETFIQ